MRREIKSIDALSAGKVGCLWGALLTAILGCIGIFLPLLALPSLFAISTPDQSDAAALLGGGFVTALVTYLGAIVTEAIVLAIVFAVGALIYNIVANLAGGLIVDLKE